jgi:hypothetical protein
VVGFLRSNSFPGVSAIHQPVADGHGGVVGLAGLFVGAKAKIILKLEGGLRCVFLPRLRLLGMWVKNSALCRLPMGCPLGGGLPMLGKFCVGRI